MEKIKILYFVDRMLKGGIQSLVVEIAKNIDKERFQLDFLLLDDGKKYELEDTLKTFGCNVYKLNGIWINKVTDYISYKKALKEFFKKHNDYEIVHMHSSSKNFYVLKYAKKYGVRVRIAHSHNIDFQTKNRIKKLAGNIFKLPLRYYATDYFTCSKLAGEWLFGKKNVKNGKVKIIHNAIDYDKFKFNENTRIKIRKELNIAENELVIGNVGRFTNQKNHTFLIDIFNEILKIRPDSKLLLIGSGIKEDEIKKKVDNLKISDKVIFTGFKENAYEYFNAMDIFIFPSLFEGLAISLIEAQANGITCFTSKDVVTNEVAITNLVHFISLNHSSKEWAEEIMKIDNTRCDTFKEFEKNGYVIDELMEKIEEIYIEKRK